ncbi:MAG: hypothetical protein B0D88_09695 [Candidatus Sedimenticola endophacoides]|nr:MAG: hypothetical protein B0D88_09695 [Candidatus Sedimenticola endophacoides]
MGGEPFAASSTSQELISRFSALFGGFAAAREDNAFQIGLHYGDVPEPPGEWPLVFEGDLPIEGYCRLYQQGDKSLLQFPLRGGLVIDRGAMRAELTLAPDRIDAMGGTLGMSLIMGVADAYDQALVHAAALTLPGDGRMVLVHAPSGLGKTTLSLALLKGGYGLASDDAAFIKLGKGITAFGLPRDLKVHRKTAEMMPWVESCLVGEWNREEERRLPRDNLSVLGRFEPPVPRPVAGLCRLSRHNGPSDIRELGQADLLSSLAGDNLRVGRGGLPPRERRQFALFARLVGAVPIFELRMGSDLGRIPALLDRHLS